MREDISFGIVVQPRTADGGFGEIVCEKCEAKGTVFLKITPGNLILCKGCLVNGSDMISDGIIAKALRGRL